MIKGEILNIPFNGRMKDIKGQRFGRLVVEEYVGLSKSRRAIWKCKCDCGKEDLFLSNSLLTGRTVSCGCYHIETISKDYSGQRFGKLTILHKIDKQNKTKGGNYYLCQCDCGNLCEVHPNDFVTGNVRSCGCLRSRKEFEISELFKSLNIDYKTQYSFSDLKDQSRLRFDFAIFKNGQLSCLIEYNGQQHYIQSDPWFKEDIYKHDQMKIEYCNKHNIPLIIINKDNYNNLMELIKEYL